jgi:hypothetical protein
MRYFVKLNALSAIFALLPFIISELLVNAYRINRIAGIELEVVNRVSTIISFVVFFSSVAIFIILIKHFLPAKKANFLSSITRFPYYCIYVSTFAAQFPMNNPADDANPVSGLVIIAGLLLYPFILAGVNAIALFYKRHNKLIR